MTTDKLKQIIGCIFLASHFLFVIGIFVLKAFGIYDEATSDIALIVLAPLLVHFIVRIIKDFRLHKYKTTLGRPTNSIFAFFSILFPSIFLGLIALALAKQAFEPDPLETFAGHICASDTFIGVYMGGFLKDLFPGI